MDVISEIAESPDKDILMYEELRPLLRVLHRHRTLG